MRPRSLPLESITSSPFQTTHPANFIKINTCETASKQTALSPFKINTYTKTGGGDPTPLPSSSASALSASRMHLREAFRASRFTRSVAVHPTLVLRIPRSGVRRFRELRNRRLRPCRRDSASSSKRSTFRHSTLRRSFPRHRDENSVTVSPLKSALTNRGARNPFRFRSYENRGVSLGSTGAFLKKLLEVGPLSYGFTATCPAGRSIRASGYLHHSLPRNAFRVAASGAAAGVTCGGDRRARRQCPCGGVHRGSISCAARPTPRCLPGFLSSAR
jgi:hypothetical protein